MKCRNQAFGYNSLCERMYKMIDIKKFLENKKNKRIVIFSAIGLAVIICVIILIIVLSKPGNSTDTSSGSSASSSTTSSMASGSSSGIDYDPTASMTSMPDEEFESVGEILDFED